MESAQLTNIVMILMGLSSLFIICLSAFAFIWLFRQHKMNTEAICDLRVVKTDTRKSSYYDTLIEKTLWKIKLSAQATKVTLSRFHNGGRYNNGDEMKKNTMTHETPEPRKEPMMDCNVSVLNSRYPTAMMTLTTMGNYTVSDVNDCDDPSFKREMVKRDYKSACLFLIRNFDGTDEGFLSIYSNQTKVMFQEDKEKVMVKLPKLLGLINMIED